MDGYQSWEVGFEVWGDKERYGRIIFPTGEAGQTCCCKARAFRELAKAEAAGKLTELEATIVQMLIEKSDLPLVSLQFRQTSLRSWCLN